MPPASVTVGLAGVDGATVSGTVMFAEGEGGLALPAVSTATTEYAWLRPAALQCRDRSSLRRWRCRAVPAHPISRDGHVVGGSGPGQGHSAAGEGGRRRAGRRRRRVIARGQVLRRGLRTGVARVVVRRDRVVVGRPWCDRRVQVAGRGHAVEQCAVAEDAVAGHADVVRRRAPVQVDAAECELLDGRNRARGARRGAVRDSDRLDGGGLAGVAGEVEGPYGVLVGRACSTSASTNVFVEPFTVPITVPSRRTS